MGWGASPSPSLSLSPPDVSTGNIRTRGASEAAVKSFRGTSRDWSFPEPIAGAVDSAILGGFLGSNYRVRAEQDYI